MSRIDFEIPIFVSKRDGIPRDREWIRCGVPFPKGMLADATAVVVIDAAGRRPLQQARALATWPDRTVKWLLVDVLANVDSPGGSILTVRPADPLNLGASASDCSLAIEERDGSWCVDTGAAQFQLPLEGPTLVESVRIAGVNLLGPAGASVRLRGCRGRWYEATTKCVRVEEAGPVLVSMLAEGDFRSASGVSTLQFKARFTFVAGATGAKLEFLIRNPRAAQHPGGLWDLADSGTALFEDVSLSLAPRSPVHALHWYAESPNQSRSEDPVPWSLYQDSSGGENWDSPNHLDHQAVSSVTFRGYRVRSGEPGRHLLIAEGDRATPALQIVTATGAISATVDDFWQNFPKALRWNDGSLSVGLFPGESRSLHALQGGEQKRHIVFLEFGPADAPIEVSRWQQRPSVSIDPSWVESSCAVASFVAAKADRNEDYQRYVGAIVEGPHAFASKREIIDEYGWRNFGDLYADHEAVNDSGPRPLVSHYNNQYDFVQGALVNFLRTGDDRWRLLGEQAARHTIDIDIYHTDEDWPAFNHGLFWHTDHHKPAATCTHRTYSAHNGRAPAYGGGPSNEHNYTSGLLLYYYLSGDPEAASAVRDLGRWVVTMDDGAQSPLSLLDAGPTGLASKTVDDRYHKAGRGAGNSINALLDVYQLCGEQIFLIKVEELIRRCIHPDDDIDALGLSEPEFRWSYLVFLQALGKYIHVKLAWHESDYMLHYARGSLLHYARWMMMNEVPYTEVLHKVELPTETWPAHDIRKCHVLHLAGELALPSEGQGFHQKATFFFERALRDLLTFKTAFLTRPLVIFSVYGHVHSFFEQKPGGGWTGGIPPYSFGQPGEFETQRWRWGHALPQRIRRLAGRVARGGAIRLGLSRRYTTPWRL